MIVLVAVLGLIALGIYLFPRIHGSVSYQDCVASGRTDCANASGG